MLLASCSESYTLVVVPRAFFVTLVQRNEGSGNEIACFPTSPCGRFFCHFGLHFKEAKGVVFLAPLEYIARAFSETRLVSWDIRFPLPFPFLVFVFACLNVYFCDGRIHFRFRCLASIVVQQDVTHRSESIIGNLIDKSILLNFTR